MTLPQGNPPAALTPAKKSNALLWVLAGCATVVVVGGILASVALWWGYHKARSYAEGALGNTGEMKTAVHLWSDVPPLEGMTPSQQAEMPMAIRVLARPFLDTMMKGLNNGKNAGHWDVAYYTLNGKTTHDVETFYVPDRMGKFGWQPQGGCAHLNEATFCSFQKQENNKGTGLLIIAAEDQEHKFTALYFIRGEGQPSGNSTGAQ